MWNMTAGASEPKREARPEIVSIEFVSPAEGKILYNTELKWKVVYKDWAEASEPDISFVCKSDRGYAYGLISAGSVSEDNGDGTKTVYIISDETRAPGKIRKNARLRFSARTYGILASRRRPMKLTEERPLHLR